VKLTTILSFTVTKLECIKPERVIELARRTSNCSSVKCLVTNSVIISLISLLTKNKLNVPKL
jgi:hypothetical protein